MLLKRLAVKIQIGKNLKHLSLGVKIIHVPGEQMAFLKGPFYLFLDQRVVIAFEIKCFVFCLVFFFKAFF